MSSTNLFNMKYFIENVKKSKSTIIFISIILPIFAMLNLLLFGTENLTTTMDFTTLSVFHIMFMYVIPVALSISLFNYVYKKNSADFIGSMPLSRKTIFTTNTIGGIAILAGILLITGVFMFLLSLVLSGIVIFKTMILDVLIYYLVAYIFVFITCNLAMSFSGNMFATIASTMVILFFIPFLLFTARVVSSESTGSYYSKLATTDNESVLIYDQFNFTAPSYVFDCMANSVEYEFNVPSILKMIGLSVAYYFLGLFLFKRKKYEMAEESFENDTVHLIFKFLSYRYFLLC